MTARDDVHRALGEVVRPYLRAEGFTVTGQTWRLVTPEHDFGVVDVQSSKWNRPEMYECVMNLGVVPAPWWDWQQSYATRGRQQGLRVTGGRALPSSASGLFRGRLHAGGIAKREQWWKVQDLSEAYAAAEDMVAQLQMRGIPLLRRLLDRRTMLEVLRTRAPLPFGDVLGGTDVEYFRRLAVLLSDHGPSPELYAVVAKFEAAVDQGPYPSSEWKSGLTSWVRSRAGTLGAEGKGGI
jgi:Domain of unknown function (DUF4304)